MKRETSLLTAVLFFLATAPLMLAQDHWGPSPVLPSDILGSPLIAWSQLQKPQPMQQSLAQSDRAVQQADQQLGQPATLPAEQQSPAAQTLTGTIVKDGDRYILKVSNSTAYQLDNQDKAKQYEGKQVKIAGTLDANGNSFHIISIELIS